MSRRLDSEDDICWPVTIACLLTFGILMAFFLGWLTDPPTPKSRRKGDAAERVKVKDE